MCCLNHQGSFDPSFNNDASKCSALVVILVPSKPLIISRMASNSSKLDSNLENRGFWDLCNPLTKLFVVGSVVERVPTWTRVEASWIKKKARQCRRQIISGDASIQCDIGVVSRSAVCTSDASVQTEYYDVTSELQQQIQNLAEMVKQLTSLKFIHQHEPKIPASPDDPLSDPVLDPALSAVIENM